MSTYTIFNGHNLDEEVTGFWTLKASGTRFADIEVESEENVSDGSAFLRRRIPLRKIEVDFAIKASGEDAIKAQDQLQKILHTSEPCKLILYNESSVYYNAVCAKIELEDDLRTIRNGTITFECFDPFKYAIEPKTFTAEAVNGILTANVVNNGNVPVPIDYEITMSGDNGYIGIVSDHGAMQYGFVDEEDGHEYTRSERLMTIDTVYVAADDAVGAACYIQPDFNVSGTLAKTLSQVEGRYWLYPKVIGSGSVWHGGQKTIEIPADSNGSKGCKNFFLYMRHWFENWKLNELGYQGVSVLDADNKVICGIQIYKCAPGASKTYYNLVGNGKVLKQNTFQADPSSANCFRSDNGNNCIRKENDILTFYFFGYKPFSVPEITDSEAVKVQITIGGFGTYAGMTRNYLGAFDLDKLNVEKYSNDPNRYSAGDVLTIDGSKGRVYVNGLTRMDEITGTTYFPANSGSNQIEFYKSTWANDITAKATIREAWL